MRILACLAAVGIIASLAFAQARATPGQPKPERKPEAKPKTSSTPLDDDQRKAAAAGPAAGAASDKAESGDAKPGIAKSRDQAKRNVQEILNARIPDVNFDATPLEEVMEWLQDYTEAIVYVRWAALEDFGITRETPITVEARNKRLSQILWVVMNEAAAESGVTLAYQASADLFLFSTHEDLSRSMVTRVYNVREIIVDVPYFFRHGLCKDPVGEEGIVKRTRVRRVWRDQGSRGGELGTELGTEAPEPPRREITSEDEALQELTELILNTVEPETWEANGMGGKGTIFPYKGKLVVRNSIYVHQILSDKLKPR